MPDDEPSNPTAGAAASGRRGVDLVAVLGAALLLVGAAAFAYSFALHPTTTSRLVGGNLPVNTSAVDPLVVTAENSPTVARNPRDGNNLVAVYRVDRPTLGCGLSASADGGATWSQVLINAPTGKQISCFGPDAAFGPDGTLYVSFTSFDAVPEQGNAPDAVWVETSTDGGRTLGQPAMASGPMAFQVRVAADPATPRRLFLTWTQAAGTVSYGFSGPGNPIVVSRSDDAGATWSPPTKVSPPSRARVVGPAPLAAGDLYVAYLDVGNDRLDYEGAHEGKGGPPYDGPWSIVVARSADGGATWSETVADAAVVPPERFTQISVPTPALAVRGSNLYVGYTDARSGDPDVYVWRSGDGGRSWANGVRVNDTRKADGLDQYRPALGVAPNGRLDVAYYDRRADPKDAANEVSLQSSFDSGRTFDRRTRLSDRAFDSRIGLGSERGLPDLGSRVAVVSTDAGALGVWGDTRNGTDAIQKQLLARGFVSVDRSTPSLQPVLRFGGLAAALAGLVVVLVARRGRGRRPVV